jgi:hypothetical protein
MDGRTRATPAFARDLQRTAWVIQDARLVAETARESRERARATIRRSRQLRAQAASRAGTRDDVAGRPAP